MRRVAKSWMFNVIGVAFTALGVVGMFVPVLPTVPFLLVALWAFARGSRRLHDWLLNHPRVGAPVRAWKENGAIPRRGKILAAGSMSVSAGWLLLFSPLQWWGVALALVVIGYGLWFVLSRPTLESLK